MLQYIATFIYMFDNIKTARLITSQASKKQNFKKNGATF